MKTLHSTLRIKIEIKTNTKRKPDVIYKKIVSI